MKRPPLNRQILDMLAKTGPVSTTAIAARLGCSAYQVAPACGALKRAGVIHRAPTLQKQGGGFPSNRFQYGAVWSIGPEPPAAPRTPDPGITADDLDWMAHYRQQAQQRQQRRGR